MKWRKGGLIYAPKGDAWWARSYAFNPTAEVLDDETIRVYFASLDEDRFGRIGFIEVDATDPAVIRDVSAEPILDVGELGTFDDSGVNPCSVLRIDGRTWLYYIGWQRCERVPYMLFTGLAFAEGNDRSFKRHARIPILDRTPSEPFSRSALCVLRDKGIYRGWYWSCESWTADASRIHYNNVIRYAESNDGIQWRSSGPPCLLPEGRDDYSVGRPWVIHENSLYKMWYSIRSLARTSYRIGYAESTDGSVWTAKEEEAGIAPAETGWDSEMICSPCVVDAAGNRYLFYNGNRHGSTGFGYAVLEE